MVVVGAVEEQVLLLSAVTHDAVEAELQEQKPFRMQRLVQDGNAIAGIGVANLGCDQRDGFFNCCRCTHTTRLNRLSAVVGYGR